MGGSHSAEQVNSRTHDSRESKPPLRRVSSSRSSTQHNTTSTSIPSGGVSGRAAASSLGPSLPPEVTSAASFHTAMRSGRGGGGGGGGKISRGGEKNRRSKAKPTVAPPRWENDRDHKRCMNCFSVFSLTTRRHHCRRCGKVYCSACCYQQTTIPHMYGAEIRVRVCISCSCPLFRLSDAQLQFIQVFLPYRTHDKLLRVCKRFQKLVIVPFPRLHNLASRFQYREADDVLHVSKQKGGSILRCQDLQTGQQRAVKIVRKDSMYSRGDWQSLQFWMDTASILNHPAFPNLFDVVQSPEAILVISELIPPNSYISLRLFAQTCHPDETMVCRVVYNILDAILYLHHDVGLVHRNLSPDTILVDPVQLGIKITGLHFAKRTRGDGTFSSYGAGTGDQYHRPVVSMNLSPTAASQNNNSISDQQRESPLAAQSTAAAASSRKSSLEGAAAGGAKSPTTATTSTTFTSKSTAARSGGRGGGAAGGGGGITTTSATTPGVLRPLPQIATQGESTVFNYRHIRRPPPLQLNLDKELERKSALYSRTAKHRTRHEQSDIEKLSHFAEPPQSAFPQSSFSPSSSSAMPPPPLSSPGGQLVVGSGGLGSISGSSLVLPSAAGVGGGSGGVGVGFYQEALCASPRGSPGFAAPEVVEMYASRNPLTNQRLTPDALEKWDVYSCGSLLYYMLTHGKTPWETSRWEVLALRMYDPRFITTLGKKSHRPYPVSNESQQLLEIMMAPTADLRCSASQALQSPVFAAETLKQNMVPPTAPMQRTRKKSKNDTGPFR